MIPGDTIGRYVIERVLGRGAMGEVYLAEDPMIGRKIALKTLRTDVSNDHVDEFKERFLREARAAGRLSHPNIITVFDIGEDAAQNMVFIAMEFVDGTSLEDLISRAPPMAGERIAELGATLAEALDYAHREGVIHRDIKPANILLNADDRPKITDFGIARLGASQLTVEGARLGTPYYMSPEQVNGEEVDGRTDLYALGVILFEVATGTRPFTGNSFFAMMRAILEQPIPDPAAIRPDLPRSLSTAIQRCLAKDRIERFASGAELAAALRREPGGLDAGAEVGATVVAPSMAQYKQMTGSLKFAQSDRCIHVRSAAELTIGRDPQCEIRLDEPAVSRNHALISFTDSGVVLEDLSSSNGTTHNGNLLTAPVTLSDADVLGIGGSVHFLVRVKGRIERPRSVSLIAGTDEYLISRGEILIGTDPVNADIRIPDRSVLPVHARIRPGYGAPTISSEGEYALLLIDGERQSRARLGEQVDLQVGQVRLLWSARGKQQALPGPTRY